MSSTTPHHIFIDNTVEYISLEDSVEIIDTKNNEILNLQSLVAEKEEYIEQFEKKTCNWVLNLKKDIELRDKQITTLEEIIHEMARPVQQMIRQYERQFTYPHDIPSI